jgi:hypothetical protein
VTRNVRVVRVIRVTRDIKVVRVVRVTRDIRVARVLGLLGLFWLNEIRAVGDNRVFKGYHGH